MMGSDLDELGCWLCKKQLEAVRSALASEHWISLQSEQEDAWVGEEGAWLQLNTPLVELQEQLQELS